VDEATHDLDPEASADVRAIVEGLATEGAAVLWATQRIDEIRGFADRTTLLGSGQVRFTGSVPALMAHAKARRFVLRLEPRPAQAPPVALQAVLGRSATIVPLDGEHWILTLGDRTLLGDAIAMLAGAGVGVLGCHRERSELEEAFVALSRNEAP
jgi:ABC-type multidrug transport system ATPase subunit